MKLHNVHWHSTGVNIPGVPLSQYDKEFAFQIYCATWLRKQFELTHDPRFANWHHSANERQGARAGQTAKLMGQSKGIPDLLQFEFKCALELKVANGQLTPAQKHWLSYFKSIGWIAEVVRGFDQFKSIVLSLPTPISPPT